VNELIRAHQSAALSYTTLDPFQSHSPPLRALADPEREQVHQAPARIPEGQIIDHFYRHRLARK
jgi:hypothetical protein